MSPMTTGVTLPLNHSRIIANTLMVIARWPTQVGAQWRTNGRRLSITLVRS
jgi:hypothetical protein